MRAPTSSATKPIVAAIARILVPSRFSPSATASMISAQMTVEPVPGVNSSSSARYGPAPYTTLAMVTSSAIR